MGWSRGGGGHTMGSSSNPGAQQTKEKLQEPSRGAGSDAR